MRVASSAWATRQFAAIRRRPAIVIAAIAIAALAGIAMARRAADWHHVYVRAARDFIELHDLYSGDYGFVYPPAAVLIAIPFAYAPAWVARLGYTVINAIALAVFWWSAWSAAGGRSIDGRNWRELAAIAAAMTISLRFAVDVLANQQTDLIIAALLTLAAREATRDRHVAAAVLCGIGAAIKATPLIFMAYFVVTRRWAAVAAMTLTATAMSLVPQLLAAPADGGLWLAQWVRRFVLAQLTGETLGLWFTAPMLNQSLAGTIHRLLAIDWPPAAYQGFWVGSPGHAPALDPAAIRASIRAAVLATLALAFLPVVVAQARRGAKPNAAQTVPPRALEYSALFMAMVLASPASSKPHFVIALLPALCLARLGLQNRARHALICLSAALLAAVASGRALVGRTIGENAQWAGAMTWMALALLLGCVLALLLQTRSGPDGAASR